MKATVQIIYIKVCSIRHRREDKGQLGTTLSYKMSTLTV